MAHEDWQDYQVDEFYDNLIAAATADPSDVAKEYAASGLWDRIMNAHKLVWPTADGLVVKAQTYLTAGDYAEAVFVIARAYEGYLRSVYLQPLYDTILEPFNDRVPHSKLTPRIVFKADLRDNIPFISFSLLAMTDVATTERIIKDTRKFLASPEWGLRGRTFHTLAAIEEASVLALHASVTRLLADLRDVLQVHIDRVAEDKLRVQQLAAQADVDIAELLGKIAQEKRSSS